MRPEWAIPAVPAVARFNDAVHGEDYRTARCSSVAHGHRRAPIPTPCARGDTPLDRDSFPTCRGHGESWVGRGFGPSLTRLQRQILQSRRMQMPGKVSAGTGEPVLRGRQSGSVT
jgi:hypothetical protein